MNPVILSSTVATDAQNTFQSLIDEPSGTVSLIIVLGTDSGAQKAQDFANDALATAPQNFVSIQFIFCAAPQFILDQLQQLTVSIQDPLHPLDWANFNALCVIAVSPSTRAIADVLTSAQINTTPNLIKGAILHALNGA